MPIQPVSKAIVEVGDVTMESKGAYYSICSGVTPFLCFLFSFENWILRWILTFCFCSMHFPILCFSTTRHSSIELNVWMFKRFWVRCCCMHCLPSISYPIVYCWIIMHSTRFITMHAVINGFSMLLVCNSLTNGNFDGFVDACWTHVSFLQSESTLSKWIAAPLTWHHSMGHFSCKFSATHLAIGKSDFRLAYSRTNWIGPCLLIPEWNTVLDW